MRLVVWTKSQKMLLEPKTGLTTTYEISAALKYGQKQKKSLLVEMTNIKMVYIISHLNCKNYLHIFTGLSPALARNIRR